MPRDLNDTPERASRFFTGEVIELWPNEPQRIIENVPPESTFKNRIGLALNSTMLRNVSQPTLTVFRPEAGNANGCSVIVCPGGGWSILAWEHEGTDVVEWLAERGYTVYLLKYRLSATPEDEEAFHVQRAEMAALFGGPRRAAEAPTAMDQLIVDEELRYAREVAADDGRRALAVARERTGEFGLDPERVGMMGFSAGAFLVADVAMDPGGAQPAFLAPIYGGETRGRPVPADAPPLFTVVAQDDRLLFHMVEGLYLDWSAADRSAELHVFARGAHGFGMAPQGLPSDRWIDLFGDWLADQGFS